MREQCFQQRVHLPVAAAEAYRWHARPGALQRLLPPWENAQVLTAPVELADGVRVELRVPVGPFAVRWVAEHKDCVPDCQFRDVAVHGPFPRWDHLHRFTPDGPDASWLEDRIEYALPGGRLAAGLAEPLVAHRLARMFRYRHDTTAADLALHAQYAARPRWNVGITGAGGLVGSALAPFLTAAGHHVVRIPRTCDSAVFSQAALRDVVAPAWTDAMENAAPTCTAIVHLAGESIAAGRWTMAKRARIRDSRVQGTRTLCESLARLERPPQVLLCASAVGDYGAHGDALVDEDGAAGNGFLAAVAREWEAAAAPAVACGIRVVFLRFGMILTPRGGALARMLLPFQVGLGGRVGPGTQYWSWIALDDVLSVILHALMSDDLTGPINVVAPQPVTNAEFTAVLGRVLQRPTLAPVPALAARALLGKMADELLLAGVRAVPARLQQTGYAFRHADLENALRHLLGRAKP